QTIAAREMDQSLRVLEPYLTMAQLTSHSNVAAIKDARIAELQKEVKKLEEEREKEKKMKNSLSEVFDIGVFVSERLEIISECMS
ncbi:hypothetical protein PFISCL1PPCAC_20282, partial [Pristionchus fissidentatus]